MTAHDDSSMDSLQYVPPHNLTKGQPGQTFDLDLDLLRNLELVSPHRGHLHKTFIKLIPENMQDFVVATAASGSYVQPALATISSVQEYLPYHQIYFYNLGDISEKDALLVC